MLRPVFRIRIRNRIRIQGCFGSGSGFHHFWQEKSLLHVMGRAVDPDPHGSALNMRIRIQEGKFWGKNRKNARKLVVIVILFYLNEEHMDQIHSFNFKAIFFVFFNSLRGDFHKFCSAGSGSAFKKLLDPDPHWEEQLDPDPQKMNADPQPWLWVGGRGQGKTIKYKHWRNCLDWYSRVTPSGCKQSRTHTQPGNTDSYTYSFSIYLYVHLFIGKCLI